jgi:hypothetical protein
VASRPHRRPITRWLAVASLAAVAFLAGMATRGTVGTRSPGGAEAATAAQPAGSESERVDAGAPGGFGRNREGAETAAIAYTAGLSQRLLYLDPDAAEAAVRSVAAEASADALVTDVLTALAPGHATTWWVVQPLATRLVAYGDDRARVSVWTVRVLSQAGVAVPQSSWVTETVELVWEHGGWRVWSDETTPGPTPVLDGSDLPASAAELDRELTGFRLVDGNGGTE